MEALLLMLDAVGMIIVAYMGMMDDRRGPKQPERSWFRMKANRFAKTDPVFEAAETGRARSLNRVGRR